MPKQVDHEQYRKELLEKSFDCFAERGYGTVTMRELAKNAGVSTGTLYHYFPSKKDIFEALVEHLADKDLATGATMARENRDLRSRVTALIRFLETNRDYLVKQTVIWVDYYRHQEGQLGESSCIDRAMTKFREFVGFYLQTEDSNLITMIVSLLNGYVLEVMGPHDHFDPDGQIELLVRILETHGKN